ncbi:MAG TPA: hypothetical protein VN088_00690 [Nocardioides sp.]|nr:hypothetical protein [Nocardioides sp.]
MTIDETSTTVKWDRQWEKLFAWSGLVFAVLCLFGLEVLGPQPPSFSASSSAISSFYVEHRTRTLLLMTFCSLSMPFLIAWTIQIAVMLWRRTELSRPAIVVAIVSLSSTPVLLSFDLTFFGVAAYRAGHISPDVTQALSDIAWIGSMLIWPPLTAAMVIIGVLILQLDTRALFPRWLGWYSLWCAAAEPFQGLIIFFKHGPFGPRGITTWYLAVPTWGFWIVAMSVVMVRALGARDEDPSR